MNTVHDLPALLHLYAVPPRREDDRLPRLMDEAERGIIAFEGVEVVTYAWGPADGPPVLLVHGWGSRAADMAAFVRPLTKAGRRVLAFDGVAHGETPGETTSMLQFARLIRALSMRHGGFAGIVGHSIGAAATAYGTAEGSPLAGDPARAERLVLLALPASLPRMTEQFTAEHALSPAEHKAFCALAEDRYGIRLEDFEVRRIARGLPQPVLLVHDRDDPEAPYPLAAAVAGSLPDARLAEVSGLGHAGLLAAREVVREVAAFLT